MLRGLTQRLIVGGVGKVPGLRRLPVFKLIAIAEIALLARSHVARLEPTERRRLIDLLRKGRGRATNLSSGERDEFQRLVAKTEPRLFAGVAADKLSPVPLPRLVTHGRRRRRR